MTSFISIVVPVYNEQENLPEFYRRIGSAVDQSLDFRCEFLFVNDGSIDDTAQILRGLADGDRRVKVINFTKNYGSHASLLAGLIHTTGEAAIVLSADLQDPPEIIPTLVSKWREGFELVAGVRASRKDPFLKRLLARTFYFIFASIADTDYPKGGTDFFLVDRKIIEFLASSIERNAFLMAQIFSLGFKRVEVPYQRAERFAGTSKWTLGKRFKGAIDYFVAYTYVPIRLMSYAGLVVAALGFVYAAVVAINAFRGNPTEGWSSLMIVLLVISGFQMLMMGVMGEYVWRMLDQVRQRPKYVIANTIGFDPKEETAEMHMRPMNNSTTTAPGPLPEHGDFDSLDLSVGYFGPLDYIGKVFHVSGWMLAPLQFEFSTFALYINHELVEVVTAQSAPSDFGIASARGVPKTFEFHLPERTKEIANFSRIEVVGCTPEQPVRRLATLFRTDIDSHVPTPPEELMERVTGNRNGPVVKAAGLRCCCEFLDTLGRYRDLSTIRRLLDWGCGCGRVTVHLKDFLSKYQNLEVYGCDIDKEAIGWCKNNLDSDRFSTIEPFPPTQWADNTFDAVVSCSVFTHLAKDVQKAWLNEMRRIIVPGGLFLASIVTTFPLAQIPEDGIYDDVVDVRLEGIAPDGYYRSTHQTRDYTVREWSSYFEVLEFTENGIESSQDLVVMRNHK
ncbi:MAG: glycosyltransferase [Acidobacteriota bacterium]|nr:glycosyltransferase [Acidobacteriota bacterium]